MAASLKPEEFDLMPTLGDVPRHHGRTRADKLALSFEGRLTTYGEFDRRTSQVADALIAAGVKPGDRVAYLGKNSDHYFELVLGAAKAGAIIAPIGWRLAPAEVAYIVDDTQAKLLFVGAECVACAAAAWVGIGRAEWAVLVLTIAGVLVLEALNTAIEAIVDLASPRYHPLARAAKDVAAGMVLLSAIAAVVVGLLILGPPLWARLNQTTP